MTAPNQITTGAQGYTGVAVSSTCSFPFEVTSSEEKMVVGLRSGTITDDDHLFCRITDGPVGTGSLFTGLLRSATISSDKASPRSLMFR